MNKILLWLVIASFSLTTQAQLTKGKVFVSGEIHGTYSSDDGIDNFGLDYQMETSNIGVLPYIGVALNPKLAFVFGGGYDYNYDYNFRGDATQTTEIENLSHQSTFFIGINHYHSFSDLPIVKDLVGYFGSLRLIYGKTIGEQYLGNGTNTLDQDLDVDSYGAEFSANLFFNVNKRLQITSRLGSIGGAFRNSTLNSLTDNNGSGDLTTAELDGFSFDLNFDPVISGLGIRYIINN